MPTPSMNNTHPVQPLAVCDHQTSALLEITWSDDRRSRLPHRWLRARCRCAACQQRLRTGAAEEPLPAGLHLTAIHPVGSQGLNLVFSDGHGRGIYPWAYLRELGDLLPVDAAARST